MSVTAIVVFVVNAAYESSLCCNLYFLHFFVCKNGAIFCELYLSIPRINSIDMIVLLGIEALAGIRLWLDTETVMIGIGSCDKLDNTHPSAYTLPVAEVAPLIKEAIRKLKLYRALQPDGSFKSVRVKWIIDYAEDDLERMLKWESLIRGWNKCAIKIQCAWSTARADPYHPFGKRRLLKEFEEMQCELL